MAQVNISSTTVQQLEDQLNSFDLFARKQALDELARRVKSSEINVPDLKNEVNLHYHTFFSYNANGWSPSRIAWEARKYGLAVAGIVDFDVLDGMEEFLEAGETIGIRATAALETRVFVSELGDQVMSSPNEPGIAYYMGAGFFSMPDAGTKAAEILQTMRDMATRRNVLMMERVNAYLEAVQLNYDADVIPLTPSGNATERHILAAYDAKSRQVFSDESSLAEFWSRVLDMPQADTPALIADTPKFHDKMRAKLMKFGGVGYVSPTTDTFPPIELTIEMMQDMGALPMITWLDGTNPGEADAETFLGTLAAKGSVAMNIIPDRNWNIKDSADKQIKIDNLAKVIKAARELDLPLCVGTEMNKAGLPFVDDFSAVELQPYIDDFIEGAYFLWGHTFLARNAGMGYMGEWANAQFGCDRAKKNRFYARVGRLANPTGATDTFTDSMSSDDVIKLLKA